MCTSQHLLNYFGEVWYIECNMHKLDQKGELLIPLILVSTLLLVSIGFGAWAFMGMQDYKNNSDQKSAEAVAIAEENLTIKKDAEFAESYKLPYTTYQGPAAFGTLTIQYPKTWSNYLNDSGGIPVDGYMQPGYVSAKDEVTNYSLRYQVTEQQYDEEIRRFESRVRSGRATTKAYRSPKQESILGMYVSGELETRKQGAMVILPLRDKTIKIWTEGEEFRGDFEKILQEFTFVP